MADQSVVTLGVDFTSMGVEQEGGKRKGRCKSREPSQASEDLGDFETCLAKGALDAAIDKLASEGESLRLFHMDEYAPLRDENRSLKEQVDKVEEENAYLRRELDRVMGKLKKVEQQMSLVAIAMA
ncbi:hypothetical protein GH714_031783 [Hevea brasiliensis]|uniref:Uncharacterized protein n=1 Tax=Hevea brasiliensis TaxID=3981 RepID=A0A6A6LD84_HEVBR|nr:hypothetical protein GH714_031783 [Hevea brasiliensis]